MVTLDSEPRRNVTLAERFCLLLNAIPPKPKPTEQKNPAEYAQEGYRNAAQALAQYRPHVSLTNAVVLDAGCGLGGKTVYYSEQSTRQVIGVDFDSSHVRYARSFADNKDAAVDFLVADLSALPLSGDLFDAIFLNDVVEHIRRPALTGAFLECRRVLKPGGKIYLQFPPWSCYNASHLYRYISIPWCHLLFSQETLVSVLERYETKPRFGNLSYIEHFKQLNHLELDGFRRIVRDCGFSILNVKRRMIKKLNVLRHLPVLRRFLTTRIVAILTKE